MTNKASLFATPEWFDLKKYQGVADLDIWGWHWNIMRRLMLAQMREPQHLEYFRDEFQRTFSAHLQTPVVPRRSPHQADVSTLELVTDERVSDALYHAESLMEDKTYARAFEAHKLAMNTTETSVRDDAYGRAAPIDDSMNDFIAKKFPGSARYVYAQIDIQAPIDRLVKSFETWVREVKQRRNMVFSKKRVFKATDFSKWARYMLLPYFDIKLWSEVEGIDFPHDLYVKYLFADRGGDVISFFRKTVKDEAQEVFTWDCCESLAAQANIVF